MKGMDAKAEHSVFVESLCAWSYLPLIQLTQANTEDCDYWIQLKLTNSNPVLEWQSFRLDKNNQNS